MRSKVSIVGHPVHPMLVPFPIAFLVGCLVTDLLYVFTGGPFWPQASLYLALAGFVTGAAAAVVGLTDFIGIRRVRDYRAAWVHFIGNASVLVLALIRVLYSWNDPAATVIPWGLTLSVIFSSLLIITGWMGGELAYRYRIGVLDEEGKKDGP